MPFTLTFHVFTKAESNPPPLLLAPLPYRPSKAQTGGIRRLAVLHTAFREHPETSHLHLSKCLAPCRAKATSGDTEEALGRLALLGGQTEPLKRSLRVSKAWHGVSKSWKPRAGPAAPLQLSL